MSKEIHFENVALQSGIILPHVTLGYKTFGRLNSAGDNCILLPSSYAGAHVSYAQLISRARPLNPAKYFIVLVHLLGNGLSSSPSNTASPFHGPDFPNVTIADNVQLQYRLLTEHLKVQQIALVYGFSLGATQGFAWAATYPEMVQRLLAVCGSAKCWPLTALIMRGAMTVLKSDPNFRGGHYTIVPEAGLRALSRVTVAWSHTAAFFRDQLYRNFGLETAEDVTQYWENYTLGTDANDHLSMFWTWTNASTGLEELQKITARTIVMPCDQDLYFSWDEARIEAAQIPNAEFRPIISPYGHIAGVPGLLCAETLFVEQAIRDLLAR
jgi:homoserine O-acetyltransferase